ncbi:MAG: sulfotransferase domain-containing protein [Coleofasciculus sp. A1-SPW-01]|uniref:sulfotransferase domain-containing protein n=1 Tax=Coleofasciculus sp. A1-SPW-01 TaxID=3070819 RepID=UPI0032FFA9C8
MNKQIKNLPNFIIIGAPKCGTTAIFNYLNQHPQIYMPSCKEPHFFSFEGENKPHWGIPNLEAYGTLFEGVTDEIAIGEASTWYLYSKTASERIQYHLPEAKLIAILRNPVERAYSSWAFRVQCGWESITNFEQALQAEQSRICDNREWDFHYLQSGFYYTQIKRYFDLFPREQIKIYLHEDLKADPVGLLQDIFQFLNIDSNFVPDVSVKHNITSSPRNNYLKLFLARKSRLKSIVKSIIPNKLRQNVVVQLRQYNRVKPSPLLPDIRQRFSQVCKEDILKLENLIERDLSNWL